MVAKKKTSKKKVAKKKPAKKVTKKVSKKPAKTVNRDPLANKKIKTVNGLLRFGILFIIALVLYFVTSNPVLELLFGLVALVSGAVMVAFFLILIAFVLYKKK